MITFSDRLFQVNNAREARLTRGMGKARMDILHRSFKIVNSYFGYIPVLALTGLWVWSDSTRFYSLVLAILSFILYPIVYGSIVETIANTRKSSWDDLLGKHFANYLGLSLIFIIPVLVLRPLYSDMGYINKSIMRALFGTSLQCTTLYILPLVFLKRRVIDSIAEGFIYLAHNARKSMPLILLVLVTAIINPLTKLSLLYIFRSTDIALIYGMGFLHNLIHGYLGLIIFSMATIRLVEDNNVVVHLQEKQE